MQGGGGGFSGGGMGGGMQGGSMGGGMGMQGGMQGSFSGGGGMGGGMMGGGGMQGGGDFGRGPNPMDGQGRGGMGGMDGGHPEMMGGGGMGMGMQGGGFGMGNKDGMMGSQGQPGLQTQGMFSPSNNGLDNVYKALQRDGTDKGSGPQNDERMQKMMQEMKDKQGGMQNGGMGGGMMQSRGGGMGMGGGMQGVMKDMPGADMMKQMQAGDASSTGQNMNPEMMKKVQMMHESGSRNMQQNRQDGERGNDRKGMSGNQQMNDHGGNDSQNSDADMEKQKKQMNDDALRRGKESMRGLEQGLRMITAQIAKMEKKNITVPTSIKELVASLQKNIDAVKGATEMSDDVQTAIESLMEDGQDLRDIGPRLGLLENWTRMEKEATKRIATLRKQLASGKASAARAKVDVSAFADSIETALKQVEASLAEVKTVATGGDGDADAAMSDMRDSVFEPLMDIEKDVGLVREAANMNRSIARVEKRADMLGKASALLKKRGKDTSALDAVVAEMQGKLSEAKAAMGNGGAGLDREALFELVSDAEALGNNADEEQAKLRGIKNDVERTLSGENNGAAAFLSDILFWFGF